MPDPRDIEDHQADPRRGSRRRCRSRRRPAARGPPPRWRRSRRRRRARRWRPPPRRQRNAAMSPTNRPRPPTMSTPTSSGRTPGSIARECRSADRVYAWFGRPSAITTPTTMPRSDRDHEGPGDRAAAHARRRAATEAIAIAMNSRTPWRTPQPSEPRIHSPRNSDVPTTARMIANRTMRDRDPDEGRDLRDLAGDRGGFGPGKIDVRLDQPKRGIAHRRGSTCAGRGAARGGVAVPSGAVVGRPGCCSSSGIGAVTRETGSGPG